MKKKQDREVPTNSPEGEEQDVAISPKEVREVQNLEAKESGWGGILTFELWEIV